MMALLSAVIVGMAPLAPRRRSLHSVRFQHAIWEALVVDRGWSKDDYRRHLRTVLRRTLVDRREA